MATSPPRASARSSAVLLALEQQGAQRFIGEPMLNVDDLLQTGDGGRGVVNILVADKLLNSPMLYSTLLLWLLSELYERLPEVGDPDKPKLVFFFDEAHLLFTDAPKSLLDKIEQVVRLIRSKGVGVYFVTQNPLDVPETVLGPARQSCPACAARVHAARPEGSQGRRRNHARQPEARHGKGDHGACGRRSTGLVPRRQGDARRWSSARTCCRPAAGSAPQRPKSGSA
jgi:hypothetical protein